MSGSTNIPVLRPAAPDLAASPQPRTADLPSVGVVIPTRNRPELMLRALDAVLAQDYAGPLRIIVVYDGTPPDYLLARADAASGDGAGQLAYARTRRHPQHRCARPRHRSGGVLRRRRPVAAKQAAPAGRRAAGGTRGHRVRHVRDRGAPRRQHRAPAGRPDHGGARRPGQVAHVDAALVHLHGPARSDARPASGWSPRTRRAARTKTGTCCCEPPGGPRSCTSTSRSCRCCGHRSSHFAYEYATKISSLRWMMSRHPEIRGCRPGAARVYGQLACWSAASGNKRDAWHFTREAVRNNWREPRAAIAIAAASGVVSVDKVLGALQRRGHGI